jgi:NAD(P)-dependent dehydrogenase (short-subunit alcohol dehydrogenase family)
MPFPPVAIVTGAGSGIGRATALRLADLGYRLTLVGRSVMRLEATMARIAEQVAEPHELIVEPADLSDMEQAAATVAITLEQWGRLDVIVNNAATVRRVALEETDEDLLYETFATNVFGPAAMVARAWRAMLHQGSGCVVNVTSMAAIDPFPGFFAYAASKAALDSLSRSIHAEGGAGGIRAYSIAPGAVETDMLRGLFSTEEIPESQTLDPDFVAAIIVQCVQGERPEPSGSSIVVAGG